MPKAIEYVWPYAENLRTIRGSLGMEKAAAKVGRTRGTWHVWEQGTQRPDDNSLKSIVEAFGCPPEMIGYEPPRGYELVPAEWIRGAFEGLHVELREIRAYIEQSRKLGA